VAAEKKTRGPRRKRPLVPWRVPTLKGLDDLRREVRTLAKQPEFQPYLQMFEKVDEVIELQILRIRPKPPTRPEIEEIRRYFLKMELCDGKIPAEAFRNVAEKLKGSAFALGVSGIRQMYYRDHDKEQPNAPRKSTGKKLPVEERIGKDGKKREGAYN
jgi:hypothetical protein